MAKKQNKLSFAQRAKAIQNKYKRVNDPIEAADMEAELTALMQEQEAVRQEQGLDNNQEQFAGGGPVKPLEEYTFPELYQRQVTNNATVGRATNFGNNYVDRVSANPLFTEYKTNFNVVTNPSISQGQSPYLTPEELAATGEPYTKSAAIPVTSKSTTSNGISTVPSSTSSTTQSTQYDPNNRMVTNTARINSIQPEAIGQPVTQPTFEANKLGSGNLQGYQYNPKESFWDKNKQYLPSAISGVSNIASNLLLANLAKKNQPTYTPSMGVAKQINLEPRAEQMRRDATVSKNVAMRNARNLGTNTGQTLANVGAIGAEVDRGLGANLTNLYSGQEQYNVGAQNQMTGTNVQARNQAGMFNTQLQGQSEQNRLGYLSGALGTIPGVMKDVNQQKADQEMRGIMGDYYKNLGGKNYMTVGDIFKSSDGRFQYTVKGHNPDGTPILDKKEI